MAVTRWPRKTSRRTRRAARNTPWRQRRTIAKGTDSNYRSVVPRMRTPDFGFPDKLVTSLRYVDSFTLTGAAGAVGANVFRMNSLFDPDFTGVGHQPYYFDQLCGPAGTAPYYRYRVLGSKMTVRFAINNAPALAAANVGPVVVGLISQTGAGLFGSTVSALMEASNCQYAILGDKSGGENVQTLTTTFSPTRDLGVDAGDDTLSATYAANPSGLFYGIPWKVDTIGNAAVTAIVEIDYRVEFFGRNEVNQS